MPGLQGTVSQTAHVQIINQKLSDVFKFVICETKWRQQVEDNPHSHRGCRNNSGRKKTKYSSVHNDHNKTEQEHFSHKNDAGECFST